MKDSANSDLNSGAPSSLAGPAVVAGLPAAARRLPTPFVPGWQRPPWWQLPLWLSSRAGRLRLTLARAARDGDASWQALAAAHERLQQQPLADAASQRWFVDQFLSGLAWCALRRKRWSVASGWLRKFEPASAAGEARFALRWELLMALRDAVQAQDLHDETMLFLVDPLAAGNVDAVQQALDWVHERLPTQHTLGLLDTMPQALSSAPWAAALRAVCECPAAFASGKQAESWAERARPGELAFSNRLQAQALVIAARAAEWAGRLDTMLALAGAARRLDQASESVNYWHLRSTLHQPGRSATPNGPSAATPPWRRLHAMQALRRDADLPRSRALLELLDRDQVRSLEAPERTLCLQLLQRVLSVDPHWDDGVLEPATALCGRVRDLFGGQAWSESTVVFAALRLHADYKGAWGRLSGWTGNPLPELAQLTRVARVLAGGGAVRDGLMALAHDVDAIEPAWFDALPALQAVRAVLVLMRRAIDHDSGVAADLRALALPVATPGWAHWLVVRAGLLVRGPDHLATLLVDTPSAAAAWELDLWAAEVLPDDAGEHAAVSASRRQLDALSARPPDQRVWLERLAALRSARSDPRTAQKMGSQSPEPGLPALEALFELGDIATATLAAELAIEQRFHVARHALRRQHLRKAADRLGELAHQLASASEITRALWQPLVVYWHGVAAARLGDDGASALLESLQHGCMSARANGQLAMLAIQRGDLGRAAQCLHEVPDRHRGVRYARALLHQRRGDIEAARALLGDQKQLPSASPYPAASLRLHAALLERSGHIEPAITAHEAQLAADPHDAVSAARLLRAISKRQYPGPDASGPALASLIETATDIAWVRGYAKLDQLGAAQTQAAAAGHASEECALAWAALRSRALLKQRRPAEALGELDAGAAEHRRALAILRTWQSLAGLWSSGMDDGSGAAQRPPESAALQGCADTLARLAAQGGDDSEVAQWWQLARSAAAWLGLGTASLSADAWQSLAPSVLACVPALFAADAAQRQQGAAAALQALRDGAGVGDIRDDLIAATAHRTLGNSDAFVECCDRLFPSLAELPVDGAQLWLAAATLRCQRDGWRPVLEAEVPQSLADLAHPGVRLALACAYSQAAADHYENGKGDDARKHLQRARQALEALIE